MSDDRFPRIELPPQPEKGRGAISNAASRYSQRDKQREDDGWWPPEADVSRTRVELDTSRSVLTRNDSPDLPFDQSVNAYRGCEHGCIYCYARPSHAYLGLSPGVDFETRLFAKPDAARLLRQAFAKRGYQPSPLALGTNTDPYQPIERQWGITRQILELLRDCRHPVTITTKSAAIERDLDILADLAADGLAAVQISITTLDGALARLMEPRASAPQRRLRTVERLVSAGVPVTVMMAPLIPVLTDAELETIVAQAAEAGARRATYMLLRLPLEVEGLFAEWLDAHFPLKAKHVLERLRDCHEGQLYRSEFGTRQRGSGAYADMIARRFQVAVKRLGLNAPDPVLNTSRFVRPQDGPVQLSLF